MNRRDALKQLIAIPVVATAAPVIATAVPIVPPGLFEPIPPGDLYGQIVFVGGPCVRVHVTVPEALHWITFSWAVTVDTDIEIS